MSNPGDKCAGLIQAAIRLLRGKDKTSEILQEPISTFIVQILSPTESQSKLDYIPIDYILERVYIKKKGVLARCALGYNISYIYSTARTRAGT